MNKRETACISWAVLLNTRSLKLMEEPLNFLATKRYAVVTGGNKGIGFEICKQLALKGVVVVLTARDERRGMDAAEKLRASGLSPRQIVFHQLEVVDSSSIANLARPSLENLIFWHAVSSGLKFNSELFSVMPR